MNESHQTSELRAIVVGSESDRFVRSVIGLFDRLGLAFTVCEDVYQAAAEHTSKPSGKVFVVGRLEQLSREKSGFFDLAEKAGWVCCCIANRVSGGARNQVLRAMKAGVIVVNDAAQIEPVLMQSLGNAAAPLPRVTLERAEGTASDESGRPQRR